MEVEIVKFFQSCANKILDVVFLFITKMGEENFFLLSLMVLYLCYSDKFALKYIFYYLGSVALNNVVKLVCKRPRPYVESVQIYDRLHADGYSFPSGHTQGYFVQATTVSCEIGKRKKIGKYSLIPIVVFALLGVGVMLSRMYWGQHYLSDVIVGMMFGIGVVFFFDFLIGVIPVKIKDFFNVGMLYNVLAVVSAILFFVVLFLDLIWDIEIELVYKLSAVFICLSISYFLNNKKICYCSNQGLVVGFIKAIISIVVVVGFYLLFDLFFVIKGVMVFVVYLCLTLICTIILPLIFKMLFKKGYENE